MIDLRYVLTLTEWLKDDDFKFSAMLLAVGFGMKAN